MFANPRWRLFLTTCLALFLELVMIRWLGSEIRIFAFLKNIPLIVCFIALGLGMIVDRDISSKHKQKLVFWIAGLIIMIAVAPVVGISNLQIPTTDDIWIWWASEGFVSNTVRATIWEWLWHWLWYIGVIMVYLSMLFQVFLGIGELIKENLQKLPALEAYRYDLLGSLAGVVLFTLVSFWQLSPWWWAVMAFVFLWLVIPGLQLKHLVIMGLALVVTIIGTWGTYWSPYYRIAVSEYRDPNISEPKAMWLLDVNHVFFQHMGNHDYDFIAKYPNSILKQKADSYNLPYWFIKNPGDVLVVGAGTGNDVAAALRHGARSVDAVEIDPTIIKIGQQLHPNRPYQDPRVTMIVDDARNWFEKTPKRYDTIVYGLLDSHTSVSSFSSVRLDNFVYTYESFAAARRLLKPEGNLVLSFAAGKSWILGRLSGMVTTVFGEVSLTFHRSGGAEGGIFLLGKHLDLAALQNPEIKVLQVTDIPQDVEGFMPTDDWPYLYLRRPAIPGLYLSTLTLVIMLVGILSWFFVKQAFSAGIYEKFKVNLKSWLVKTPMDSGVRRNDGIRQALHFAALGAAFLLIETRSITELSLLFGSTWIVNASVIGGILVMALIANEVVKRNAGISLKIIVLGLFGSLVLNYIVGPATLTGQSFWIKFWLGGGLAALPLFFSGLLFSRSFKQLTQPAVGLGANLVGAFVGGLLENSAMIVGIKVLGLLAAVLYGLAIYCSLRWGSSTK